MTDIFEAIDGARTSVAIGALGIVGGVLLALVGATLWLRLCRINKRMRRKLVDIGMACIEQDGPYTRIDLPSATYRANTLRIHEAVGGRVHVRKPRGRS